MARLNQKLQNTDGTVRSLNYFMKRKLALLAYMLNDHPNRERILGADPAAWSLEMNDANRESLEAVKSTSGNLDKQLAGALSQLGYKDSGRENATC